MNAIDNRYRAVQFRLSVHQPSQLPPDTGREVAFAGRSNAGKSSALNVLCEQRQLARISKTPGRTQLINYFQIDAERHLVDLPGYGYARVPETVRRQWRYNVEHYLNSRRALVGLILLMDIRHPLTELDRQLLDWSAHRNLAVHALLTKADKLRRGPARAVLDRVRAVLARDYPLAGAQLFSALDGTGVAQARVRLDAWLFADQGAVESTG